MIDDFDLEDDREYPEELYPVVELSDSLLELTEKLETVREKLDDFEQRYLESCEKLRECEGYEIPNLSIIERWQNTIEEMSDRPYAFRRSALILTNSNNKKPRRKYQGLVGEINADESIKDY